MAENLDNWVDRRARLESAIPEFWNLFCIEMEGAVSSFEKRYGKEPPTKIAGKRIANCFHLVATTWNTESHERSMDVCLDLKRRKLFSRTDGVELAFLRFGLDAAGVLSLFRSDNSPATKDEASQFFLEGFFFP
jgi:hypothetical protein